MLAKLERLCLDCRAVKLISDFKGPRNVCTECLNREARESKKFLTPEHRAQKRRNYKDYRVDYMIRNARKRAVKTGLAFDLDDHRKQLRERLAQGVCEMTGFPLRLDGGRGWDSPSLDRRDPAGGYVYGNVRIVCDLMNMAMGNWGEAQLRAVMETWLKEHPNVAA